MAESTEDDEDLRLVKASATLLADLEHALPKLLWKPAKSGNGSKVHSQVKSQDLDYVLGLIEPFQSEPQLLDARLKHILPPIVDAYLRCIQQARSEERTAHLDLETAVCRLLYVLCKVRGFKVILGFLSNEPRYLEPVLSRLEKARAGYPQWQVPYVLLLWLSHLLLTPFDLSSISEKALPDRQLDDQRWPSKLPVLAVRVLQLGLWYLPTSTKAQDAASILLSRLVRRPDMQKHGLGDDLLARMLKATEEGETDASSTIYERLGPLRLLSGLAASPELSHLVPGIYRTCQRLSDDTDSFVATNAVARKLVVKIFRDVAILSLRSPDAQGPLLSFFETTSVLEDVVDFLLRSLADRDTPVRFVAAKAISLIILELDEDMRAEVVQAVLDTFKEDMRRSAGQALDFRTANPLKWHGLTLCLAHTLFKRSASPVQLTDIVFALMSALQFEQRTATGSTVGTNVRDAANFGIWSLSRRYTTDELLAVDIPDHASNSAEMKMKSIIQHVAIELILSACLDPAGNVRRGSSAALQELVGRHPNQVKQGISLVQTVDYQAVGLRSRAMISVANSATELDGMYFSPVLQALLEWRGLGSPDVASREAAASSLSRLTEQGFDNAVQVATAVLRRACTCDPKEREMMHGLVSAMALVFAKAIARGDGHQILDPTSKSMQADIAKLLRNLDMEDFSSRLLRSELPSAVAQMLAAYCNFITEKASAWTNQEETAERATNFDMIERLTKQLLARGEESIREAAAPLARSLLALKRKDGQTLGYIGSAPLTKQVAIDGAKSTLHGAGRAITLGALATLYGDGWQDARATEVVSALGPLTEAMNVEWRIIGIRALQLAIDAGKHGMSEAVMGLIVQAVHRGLNDYTIDERGDVGSLVRLQAIACTWSIFAHYSPTAESQFAGLLHILHADVLRLSLEKLDRVRLAAAQCQSQHLAPGSLHTTLDIAAVSSRKYFEQQFAPLSHPDVPHWKQQAIIEGAISAAGISAEQLLQASRAALATILASTTAEHLSLFMTLYTNILKTSLASPTSPLTTPSLTLLAFLLDMRIPQRLAPATPFKWINVLSAVQKSHHKSNDIPKIAAAVGVYRGLAEVEAVRGEVVKKLLGMLRTNPYPRVRVLVAETLVVVLREGEREEGEVLRKGEWMGDRRANEGAVRELERLLIGGS